MSCVYQLPKDGQEINAQLSDRFNIQHIINLYQI